MAFSLCVFTGTAEQIVMTPKCKTANSTTLIIERKKQAVVEPVVNGTENDVHVAGGDHKGIVINKQMNCEHTVVYSLLRVFFAEFWILTFLLLCFSAHNDVAKPAHLSLQFKVFLVSAQTGNHTQEQRILNFWFSENSSVETQATVAQEFFRELVSPTEFPRGKICK